MRSAIVRPEIPCLPPQTAFRGRLFVRHDWGPATQCSLKTCIPDVSGARMCARIGFMPVGPLGPTPVSLLEIPSHRAVTVACIGTVTATVINTPRFAMTTNLGGIPSLGSECDRPFTVTVNDKSDAMRAGQDTTSDWHPVDDRPADPVAVGPECDPCAQDVMSITRMITAKETSTLSGRLLPHTIIHDRQ
jgi:hypothetical protein